MRGESNVLRRYWHDEQGAISILAAFVLVAVVGVSALALEYGHGLLQKVENQRAADLAAYGGALVYNSTGSSDQRHQRRQQHRGAERAVERRHPVLRQLAERRRQSRD